MNEFEALRNIRVVLCEPSHPGNIGAAARALKTMGLERLVLVNPKSFPDPEADARATGALDVLGSRDLLELLATLRAEGRTILLSTHRLHEIEHRCDRFVVIHGGRVVAAGPLGSVVGDRADLEEAFFAAVGEATAE